jgi:hypothetical protein
MKASSDVQPSDESFVSRCLVAPPKHHAGDSDAASMPGGKLRTPGRFHEAKEDRLLSRGIPESSDFVSEKCGTGTWRPRVTPWPRDLDQALVLFAAPASASSGGISS